MRVILLSLSSAQRCHLKRACARSQSPVSLRATSGVCGDRGAFWGIPETESLSTGHGAGGLAADSNSPCFDHSSLARARLRLPHP